MMLNYHLFLKNLISLKYGIDLNYQMNRLNLKN